MSFKIIDGIATLNTADIESDDEWLRALRQKDKANKGDKKAQKEFSKMENARQIVFK